jgi:hypothetical protein
MKSNALDFSLSLLKSRSLLHRHCRDCAVVCRCRAVVCRFCAVVCRCRAVICRCHGVVCHCCAVVCRIQYLYKDLLNVHPHHFFIQNNSIEST